VDGVARLLGWWFPLFRERGVDPSLLVLGPSGKVVEELREDGIPVKCLDMKPYDLRAYFDFRRYVKQIQPDIIHAHNWRATTFSLWLKRSTSIPVVVHEHVISPNVPLVQKLADRALNQSVDRVLAVSDGAARNCIVARKFPPDRIETVINGIPIPEDADRRNDSKEVLRQLGIDEQTIVIGFVGRLDEQKGITDLIRAFGQLGDEFSNVVLVVVGDGPYLSALENLAEQLGIASRVLFLGYRRDVDRLRQIFTAQAMPSLWEGLPLGALEAMACGVPLVASDIPGLDEVLRNGVNAILVPPCHPEKFAEALRRALTDTECLRRMADAAKRTVMANDISANADKIVGVYRSVLRGM
jgi:glycosyltransferase involved in cell wall biosynthesis